MQVRRKSQFTGQWHTMEMDVTFDQLQRINTPGRTELIQAIVPHLSPSEREFLISGVTDAEWASMGWHEDDDA